MVLLVNTTPLKAIRFQSQFHMQLLAGLQYFHDIFQLNTLFWLHPSNRQLRLDYPVLVHIARFRLPYSRRNYDGSRVLLIPKASISL